MKIAVMRLHYGKWMLDEVRVEYQSERFDDLTAAGYKLAAVEVRHWVYIEIGGN